MKVLVTGKTGQLGSALTALLEERGHEVAAFGSAELDVTDARVAARLVGEHRPGVIVNCSAYTAVDLAETEKERAFAVNAGGAENLARAAKDAGSALIHVSTDYVFDGAKASPYTELDGTSPLGVYGRSKLEGERLVAGVLKEHVIIRTSWLYGPTGRNFVRTILALASEREALNVVYDQAGTPTSTADLAGAIAIAVGKIGQGSMGWGLYHYSNEGVASWYDFAVAIVEESRALGFPVKCRTVEPITTPADPSKAPRPAYSVLAKEKIKKGLGIGIPHWRESLRKTLTVLYGEKNA